MTPERGPERITQTYPILDACIPRKEYEVITPHILQIPGNCIERSSEHLYELPIIVGAPGGGKDSLVEAVLAETTAAARPKTATTRAPRPQEMENDPYVRLTKDTFQQMNSEGAFLEWNEHYGNFYGSLKTEVVSVIQNGQTPLLRIDPNGARSIMELAKNGDPFFRHIHPVVCFITPPTGYELYKRLFKRTLSEVNGDTIVARAKTQDRIKSVVIHDMAAITEAHYVLINEHNGLSLLAQEFMSLMDIPVLKRDTARKHDIIR